MSEAAWAMRPGHVLAAGLGALAAFAWLRKKPEALKVVHVAAAARRGTVVLVPGMWHGAWYFEALQRLLAQQGYESYALELRPGRGVLAADHLAMLQRTLEQLELSQVVLLGHSQGGILVQRLLRDHIQLPRGYLRGVVLSATVPISSLGAGVAMMSQKTNVFKEYGLVAFLFYLLTGRLYDAALIQRLFLLPSTKEISLPGGRNGYVGRLLKAPCDGWPTTEHPFWLRPSFKAMADTPVLLLGAEEDVIYPPRCREAE